MPTPLDDIMDTFASVDQDTRLELLLDYAQRLPALPKHLQTQRDMGMNKVEECQTPVFLWIEHEGEKVRIFADVAEEAPTIRGLISIMVHGLDGATPEEVQALPGDLLAKLGLSGVIRMNRAVGLAAMIARIRKGEAK
ncbi:MAG: SufE family protein [Phycisphaerales bacterium]|nr:SufE family protein [Phycisphaerales bacterium]